MKVVIIGASHGGITAAKTIKELIPTSDVVLIDEHEKDELGFISNGINLYLNGVIHDLHEATTSFSALEQLGIELMMSTVVKKLTAKEQVVQLTNKKKQQEFTLSYDKLVLAMGSSPQNIEADKANYQNFFSYKSFRQSAEALPKLMAAKKIAIIGAGYIGLELADSLKDKDKEIHLFDTMDSLLSKYFDGDMMVHLQEELQKANIQFHSEAYSLKFKGSKERLQKIVNEGQEYAVDLVIAPNLSTPNTKFLIGEVTLNIDDTVWVNDFLQTSDENIFALGDLIPVTHFKCGSQAYMPLVNRTVRMARTLALNIAGLPEKYQLWRKTSGTFVFGKFVGSTGLTEEEAPFYGYTDVAAKKGHYQLESRFAKEPHFIDAKIVYDPVDLTVIGIQLMSDSFVVEELNVAASVLERDVTLKDLAVKDFCFIPQYTQPFYFLNELAYEALLDTLN